MPLGLLINGWALAGAVTTYSVTVHNGTRYKTYKGVRAYSIDPVTDHVMLQFQGSAKPLDAGPWTSVSMKRT